MSFVFFSLCLLLGFDCYCLRPIYLTLLIEITYLDSVRQQRILEYIILRDMCCIRYKMYKHMFEIYVALKHHC